MNEEELKQSLKVDPEVSYRETVTVIGGILIFACIFAAAVSDNTNTAAMAFNLAYIILGVFAIGTFMRFVRSRKHD